MKELYHKVLRVAARKTSRSVLPPLDESIISFGFDDCPASAIETALPMLEAEGWRATIYVSCGLCETENHLGRHMSLSDIVDVHERDHEIADHTFSHISSKDFAPRKYLADIEKNQKMLKKLGLPGSRHFAFPYGHMTPALKRTLRHRFKTLRGVVHSDRTTQDANLLQAVRVYSGHRMDEALHKIYNAKTSPQWLNLFTHDVRENPSDYGCTPEEFRDVVKAVKKSGFRVMTVDDAYRTIDKRRHMS